MDIRAGQRRAAASELRCHAAYQRRRGVPLLLPGGPCAQRYRHRLIALGKDPQHAAAVGRCLRLHCQINGGGQHAPVLMIGVVAAQLHPSGR